MAGLTGGTKFEAVLTRVAADRKYKSTVRIGFLEDKKYRDGKPVAMIAAIQEYGAPRAGIPPRPYFRSMIAKHKGEWGAQMAALMRGNGGDAALSLRQIGQVIEGHLRQSIVDTMAPPLSPITLMLRWLRWQDPNLVVTGRTVGIAAAMVRAGKQSTGVSTKPLVDTGIMLDSISSEVVGP